MAEQFGAMNDLFEHFERELAALRQLGGEFARRYPKVAGNLHMVGETCDDPHVKRLIQSVALLGARISKQLDDNYPKFTQALLNALLPHYLRPFPSCSIARFVRSDVSAESNTIKRGSYLKTSPVQGQPCTFVSTYDVVLDAIELAHARFVPLLQAPNGTSIPTGATSSLSMTLCGMRAASPDTLRVYIDGEPSFCAAVRDALFMHTIRAYVQHDGSAWQPCPAIPIKPVGFDVGDTLIPFSDARSQLAYCVLTEYFGFPEKFNFFEIDLRAIRNMLPGDCNECTVHLAMTGRSDSAEARALSGMSVKNLVLGCTPVCNLFKQSGVPIALHQRTADYTVLAHYTHPSAFDIYSVDRVSMLRQRGANETLTEFHPLYTSRFGTDSAQQGGYFLLERDETLAELSPGHETSIGLVDPQFDPALVEKSHLSLELTCTNRDLPSLLKYGQPGGDLVSTNASGHIISFLRRPTRSCRITGGTKTHWRLISHLALNHHALSNEGLQALREMLTLYDVPQSPTSQRQIGGIVALACADTVAWMRSKRGTSLVHGVEVRMTLDEDAFIGASIHLFIQVIERFLSLYVQVNGFIELVVLSHLSGKEVFRCEPRSGTTRLV